MVSTTETIFNPVYLYRILDVTSYFFYQYTLIETTLLYFLVSINSKSWYLHSAGYYIYYDASDSPDGTIKQSKGDKSIIRSKEFLATSGPRCMVFRYNMHGETVGKLQVKVNNRMVWRLRNDQGPEWHIANMPIQSKKKYRVSICKLNDKYVCKHLYMANK